MIKAELIYFVAVVIAIIIIAINAAAIAETILRLMSPVAFVKNRVGGLKGYGRCPNCDNSWYWKESKSVTFKRSAFVSKGVLICADCLQTPRGLNPERIAEALAKSQWNKEEVTLARKAIEQLMAA
jgi:hypothetical protein